MLRKSTFGALIRAEPFKIFLLLMFAAYVAFIPHMNYRYPLHVDEWVHMTYSKAMVKSGSIDFPEPFPGQLTVEGSYDLEIAYHGFLGTFKEITGVSWNSLFRYFPSIMFMITVLSVYALARRYNFGWQAAFFACLIPSSVGLLGPVFAVPSAAGLAFVPMAMILAFGIRAWGGYLLLFIIMGFLLLSHPQTAILLVIILLPYILISLKGNSKHALCLVATLAIPFIVPLMGMSDEVISEIKNSFLNGEPFPFVEFPDLMVTYGYLPLAFGFLGIVILVLKETRESFGFILGLMALILMLLIFYRFHYGSPHLYNRGLILMLLMLSVVAGAGLQWLSTRDQVLRPIGRLMPYRIAGTGLLAAFLLVCVILGIAIPDRLGTNYYHMIDDHDYERFTWIADNIEPKYDKAILDPWKATAFAAITGKNVFSRIHSHVSWRSERTYEFFGEKCDDSALLRWGDISMIYSRSTCVNPDLVEVSTNVYLVR